MGDADEDTQLVLETLHSVIPVAFTTTPDVFHMIILLMCKISITRGMSIYSASGIACFSSYLCSLKKKESYDYGLLGLKLQVWISISKTKIHTLYRKSDHTLLQQLELE